MASIQSKGSKNHHTYKLTLTETSTSVEKNESYVNYSFELIDDANWYWENWGTKISYTISANGSVITSGYIPYHTTKNQTIKSDTITVPHNADGTKSISFSFSVTDNSGQSYTSGNASASGSMSLTTIPRYARFTEHYIRAYDETSVTVQWNTDVVCDLAQYSLNGSAWASANFPTYQVGGLTHGTAYTIKTRIRRTDNGLWTESDALSFTTYFYPHCTSSPDFTIGDTLTLDFYNPLSRNITIMGYSKTDGSSIFVGTTNGTRLVGFNDIDSVNKQYASIPNSQSGQYKVVVIFNDVPMTRDAGNVYKIRGNETPTINEISYFDGNESITSVTHNASEIVQNLSDLNVFFYGATPNYGAGGISKYVVTCNGKTKEFGASGTYSLGTVDSANDVALTLTAIDSRGLSVSKTINVNVFAHSAPNAIVTLQRLNNYEDETYLTVDGSISSVNGKNTMTIQYRYKASGGSYNSFVTIGDNAEQTLSLDKNQSYIFQIVVTDAFGTRYDKEHILGKGVFPLFIDTGKNSVGINCFPKGEKTLEVNEINILKSLMPYNDSTTADANSVTTQGIYLIPETSVTNYPEWNGNGILIVFSTPPGIFYQMFIKYEGSVWSRISWFGGWSSWAKLSN